jgi:hypothetical protein
LSGNFRVRRILLRRRDLLLRWILLWRKLLRRRLRRRGGRDVLEHSHAADDAVEYAGDDPLAGELVLINVVRED